MAAPMEQALTFIDAITFQRVKIYICRYGRECHWLSHNDMNEK